MRVGLALGAGGARGWAHIGVLRGLARLGVTPQVVAGSSAGALVGAAWATGKLEELETWARALTPLSFAAMLDLRLLGGGVVGGAEIVAMMEGLGIDGDIATLERGFTAVATDLASGERVELREGRLVSAVRASVALPGVITPVRMGGRWLIDGGVVDPVPVASARSLGADVVIAVDPNQFGPGGGSDTATAEDTPETSEPWGSFLAALPVPLRDWFDRATSEPAHPPWAEVVTGAVDIMTARIRAAQFAENPPDVLIEVPLGRMPVLEFYCADKAIRAGEQAVADHANDIRATLAPALHQV